MESGESVLKAVFSELAKLARTRKPLELRLLIEIVASGEQELSTRVLAARMKVSRRHLQEAKHALQADGLIVCQRVPRTRAEKWSAVCFPQELVPTGRGAISAPSEAPVRRQAGAISAPSEAPVGSQDGARSAPPLNKERARAPVDSIDRTLKPDIDRLQKPPKTKYDSEQLRQAQNELHSYMAKFGREAKPKPPDEAITAEFLDVAPWPELQNLLLDLAAERKEPGWSYAWYVTVAKQRIHGISPAQQKAMRTAQRKPPASAPDRELFQELVEHTRMGFHR